MQFARRWSRLLLRNNVANQTFFARHILAHDNDSVAHRSVRRERSLDLCGFDTIAAYLDLFIGASAKLYAPVLQVASQITSLVEPRSGPAAERVGDESLGSYIRTIQIAPRQTCAADIYLSGDANGHCAQFPIQYMNLCVIDWPSDGRFSPRLTCLYFAPGRNHGVFRWTVIVHQLEGERCFGYAPKHVTSRQHGSQSCRWRPGFLQDCMGQWRWQKANGYLILRQPLHQPAGRSERPFIDKVDARANCQVGPDLPDGSIEVRPRYLRRSILRADVIRALMPFTQIDYAPVLYLHTFRLTCRAGRIDDVREVLRINRSDRILLTVPGDTRPVCVQTD